MNQGLTTLPVEQRAQQALAAMGAPTIEVLIAKMETFKPVSEAEITDKDTFTPAWESLKEVRAMRKDIETTGKNARADATAYGKAVIAAEKELVSVIDPVEFILKEKTDAWKAAEEERKAAKRERLQRIERAIAEITAIPGTLLNAAASEIASAYEELNSRDLESESSFGEFVEKAKEEKAKALSALKTAIDRASAQEEQARQFAEMKRQHEETQAAIKAQQEEIARQQAELQRQQREAAQAKLEAERAELAAKRQQQEEAARKLKEEQDRLEREAQAKADAEAQAQAQAQADKEEAERQAALAPDKDKLINFADDLREFTKQNYPSFTSDAAKELFCVAIVGRINALAAQIKERAEQL